MVESSDQSTVTLLEERWVMRRPIQWWSLDDADDDDDDNNADDKADDAVVVVDDVTLWQLSLLLVDLST